MSKWLTLFADKSRQIVLRNLKYDMYKVEFKYDGTICLYPKITKEQAKVKPVAKPYIPPEELNLYS